MINGNFNIKNAFFHTIGTNFDAYWTRLKEKYISNEKYIFVNEKTKDNFEVDEFKSKSTFNQFINYLRAFNLIKEIQKNKEYKILKFNVNIFELSNTILSKKADDEKILIIRQSRILSLLFLINYINKRNFKNFNILGKSKKLTRIENWSNEASMWEKQVLNNFEELVRVLKLIKSYKFIKKEKNGN